MENEMIIAVYCEICNKNIKPSETVVMYNKTITEIVCNPCSKIIESGYINRKR